MPAFLLIAIIAAIVFFLSALALVGLLINDERKAQTAKRLSELSAPVVTQAIRINMEQGFKDPFLAFIPKQVRRSVERRLEATGHTISLRFLLLALLLAAAATDFFTVSILGFSAFKALLCALGAAIFVPYILLNMAQSRHDAKFQRQFPDAIDLIVRAVRAGLPVSGSIDSAGRETPDPVGYEFRSILSDMRIGVDMDEALRRAARRINKLEFSFFVASLMLQRETGGNLAETLATLSSVLRRRSELRLKAKAITSEARTSAMVLGALPFFTGGALAWINPHYFSVLLSDPRGNWILYGGLGALVAAGFTMNWQIKWAMR